MFKNIIAGVIGIGLGAAIIYFIVSKLTKKEIDNVVLDSLFNEKSEIENLNGPELVKWFKAKMDGKEGNIKMVLSYIDKELLSKYGFSLNEDVKTENVLLQFLYDEDSSNIIENRLIRFTNIDTNLQAQLEENEGLIVFSK
ncbi:MAG: hypothetical protein K6E51_01375 [Treponema sp.]|nr:hypothetical protein [Treponema sp.]